MYRSFRLQISLSLGFLITAIFTLPGMGWTQDLVLTGLAAGAPERIIGGQDAAPGAWPWMTALVSAGQDARSGQFCGGSLIASRWVLTAAHCVEGETPSSVEVVVGRLTLSTNTGERLTVKRIIVHPNYNDNTNDSDIALLELNVPSSMPVIRLANQSVMAGVVGGSPSVALGWGLLDEAGNLGTPDTLQQVTVPVVPINSCNTLYGGGITNNMVCAGAGGLDSCQGDSGGPLLFQQSGFWYLIGATSFGQGCAQAAFPGVYTRVANFESWVRSYIGGGFDQPGLTCDDNVTPPATDQLPPSACVLPNGFLGQVNIATIYNRQTSGNLTVSAEYRDADGVLQRRLQGIVLPPAGRFDFLVNEFGLAPDSVGTFCITTNAAGNGAWEGGLNVYKPRLNAAGRAGGGFGVGEFNYVLYYPFMKARTSAQKSTVALNTYSLGTDGLGTVANWIRIADAIDDNGDGVQGELRFYDVFGGLISIDQISLGDGRRIDLPGHVRIGNRAIGSAQFTPSGSSDDYYFETTRYFYEGSGAGANNFYTAFYVPDNLPDTQKSCGVFENSGEGGGAVTVLELINSTANSVPAEVAANTGDGFLISREQSNIAARSSYHKIIDGRDFASVGDAGSLRLSAAPQIFAASAVTYELDAGGRLVSAFAVPLGRPRGGTVTTQFNSFIGQANSVVVHNPTGSPINGVIKAFDFNNNLLAELGFSASARQSSKISIVLPPDRYGTLRIQNVVGSSQVHSTVRRAGEYALRFGAK